MRGKRPCIAHQRCVDVMRDAGPKRGNGSAGRRRAPVPGQKVVETALWVTIDQSFKHVSEPGVGFNAVELGGLDQRADDRPAFAAAVGAGEEMVLAPEREGANRAFDRIVVDFDAAVIDIKAKRRPPSKRVADRFGEFSAAWKAGQLGFEPRLERPDARFCFSPAGSATSLVSVSAEVCFDRIELADPSQRFSGDPVAS